MFFLYKKFCIYFLNS